MLEVFMFTAHHHIAEHIDKPPVNIISKPRIFRSLDDTFHHVVIKSEIQDGIHHSRHRDRRSAADADKQGLFRVA